ncbi:hypothetical protein JGU71_07600 [Antrihabitans sp. YC3-6]|uniref:Uncharacterized protein n=1 Tax=Antrihabitans stalagmiti TaxID=2799499 RepID=A0A934U2F0_9NOCA|nr:hypothetical protein [Antrihabitans stalagmiti]MBJ8338747.1 hypothetical protein [Antrihabitans stalagmiti]
MTIIRRDRADFALVAVTVGAAPRSDDESNLVFFESLAGSPDRTRWREQTKVRREICGLPGFEITGVYDGPGMYSTESYVGAVCECGRGRNDMAVITVSAVVRGSIAPFADDIAAIVKHLQITSPAGL